MVSRFERKFVKACIIIANTDEDEKPDRPRRSKIKIGKFSVIE